VTKGGGIIGCSTAYFLSRHQAYNPSKHSITLLEASQIAGGASGKAGGLLALWADPVSIVSLSYKLHAELALEHDGSERWGYRRIHCGQLNAKGRMPSQSNHINGAQSVVESGSLRERDPKSGHLTAIKGWPKDLDWFAPDAVQSYHEMGDPETTAQVHPYYFTTSMATLAEEYGVKIILGSALNINDQGNAVESVIYRDKNTSQTHKITATDVVICAGPWSKLLYPAAPIAALRAHSVVIRPSRPISAYAIFTEITLPPNFGQSETLGKSRRLRSKTVTPEIYARPKNEVYACGEGDTLIGLPNSIEEVETDERRCQDIIDYVSSVSDELRDGIVTTKQACYLPNVEADSGGPLIGPTGIKGLLLAAGHTCWGIQNGPATGKLISEFIFDGKALSAKIEDLDPRKVL
jgi:glycine/D-amino acid oxidase-like deaminating enzyme